MSDGTDAPVTLTTEEASRFRTLYKPPTRKLIAESNTKLAELGKENEALLTRLREIGVEMKREFATRDALLASLATLERLP